jgi:hypothetical protein
MASLEDINMVIEQNVLDEKKREEIKMLDTLHTSTDQLADDKEVRFIAICITACTFRGQYWPVGREYRGMIKPPKHFKIISNYASDTKQGKLNVETGSSEQSS